jgi:hypothetical protein
MSNLRTHFEAEKARYRAFVYPGNLAAEILGADKAKPASVMDYADSALRRRPSVLRWVVGFASLAAAALFALFIYVHHPPTTVNPARPEAVANNSDQDQLLIAPDATASIDDVEMTDHSLVPSNVDTLVPQYQSMSLPTIPSMSDLSTTDGTTKTPQEST